MQRALEHLKKSDPVLAAIIARVGECKLARLEPTCETLIRSIVFQQISTKAGQAIYKRLVEAAQGKITPASILALHPRKLRGVGLSRQKASYIQDIARRTQSGALDFAKLQMLKDEEAIAMLTEVKGVGVWTAHMFLIFALQRPNILPTGDLGVRIAIRKAYKKRKLPTPTHIEKIAKSWHPYCSVAAWYLWRSLELPKEA
jgi:DNA-3-methyladenine glycosylase II